MTFDEARGKVLMFGGTLGTGVRLGDTWTWSAGWTRQNPATSPDPRDGMGLASDAARQQVVLFGGYRPGLSGDTWTWDGSTWTLADPG
jgi:hypothetical protein